MIFLDLNGANGPSQRFLSGIARRSNDAAAATAYAKQNYDPGFNASTRADAVSFGNDAAAAKAAQGAVYGSIAQRDDPNRYGSVPAGSLGRFSGLTAPPTRTLRKTSSKVYSAAPRRQRRANPAAVFHKAGFLRPF